MPAPAPHLFVDISAHGFGHLAQAAPVLNKLRHHRPELRLTVRSLIPAEKLRARLPGEFTHRCESSDFGYVMHDAVSIDLPTTASKYRALHANWPQRIAEEAKFIAQLNPDLVLTDVAYLPLAGAALAGIPSMSMCSLNWADLFLHFFGNQPWAAPIHRDMLAAYRSAKHFLRLTPAMPMPDLASHCQAVSPVATMGKDIRGELQEKLGIDDDTRFALVAFGGFDKELSAKQWPHTRNLHWLVPQSWPVTRIDMTAFEPLGFRIIDLIHSVDVILTKPGYGIFSEAACNGTAVLYLRREDWPEQEYLIDWLEKNTRCREIEASTLLDGTTLTAALEALLRPSPPRPPTPSGAAQAALLISSYLP